MFVWEGALASEVEQTIAQGIADKLKHGRPTEIVKEGEEPEAFWEALGGKADYPHHKDLPEASREPQLFHCSNSKGFFDIQPIYDFSQADLDDADVYLLDTFVTVFIWIGIEASEQEKAETMKAASLYISKAGHPDDTPIVQVHSGAEPLMFTCNFVGWDFEKKQAYEDPYQAKLAAAMAAQEAAEKAAEEEERAAKAAEEASRKQEEEKAAAAEAKRKEEEAAAKKAAEEAATAEASKSQGQYKEPMTYSLPYEVLSSKEGVVPDGVDPTKKEQYLSDAEFEKIMGSPRGVFNQMKLWKQQQLKRAVNLF
mmetsp:Transcript_26822/g.44525  ORF Transcript_26822/g.44525 Transcript_26822/m.44525 type:complete len:311 (+) Transcript_26822:166-1098(+)